MPKPLAIDRPTRLEISLPETQRVRLELFLYSEVEGRVPQGKWSEFFQERLAEFFKNQSLDLGQFGFAPGSIISAPKPVLDALIQRLNNDS